MRSKGEVKQYTATALIGTVKQWLCLALLRIGKVKLSGALEQLCAVCTGIDIHRQALAKHIYEKRWISFGAPALAKLRVVKQRLSESQTAKAFHGVAMISGGTVGNDMNSEPKAVNRRAWYSMGRAIQSHAEKRNGIA